MLLNRHKKFKQAITELYYKRSHSIYCNYEIKHTYRARVRFILVSLFLIVLRPIN